MEGKFFCSLASPIGLLTGTSDGEGITGLWPEDWKKLKRVPPLEIMAGDLPVFQSAARWLEIYWEAGEPEFMPPLKPEGTPFQKLVWKLLGEIPYGTVTTYGELAGRITRLTGKRMSARAVGGAVGRNPIAMMIPCYRVIGSNGSLTGYAGGLEMKFRLLRREGVEIHNPFQGK